MATIGKFTKDGNDFNGVIRTLAINTKLTLAEVPNKSSENAPDYRVYADRIEIGAGWLQTSKSGREYVSVKLDDPSFTAPIFARLMIESGELIWTR